MEYEREIIPVVIGVLGMIPTRLKENLKEIGIPCKDIANPEISVIGNSKNFEEGS